MSFAELNRGSGSYVRASVAAFLRIDELDIGMLEVPVTIFIYARTDKPWRPTPSEWHTFKRAYLSAPVRAHLFFIPADTTPEVGDELARRVHAASADQAHVTDAERAAFALGGAQAVVDLILGEQRERQPVQRVLPT